MAAREARRNVALTDRAHSKLGDFRRQLSVRMNANVTYSAAVEYAIDATETWWADLAAESGQS